jgi:hypothetical protein
MIDEAGRCLLQKYDRANWIRPVCSGSNSVDGP